MILNILIAVLMGWISSCASICLKQVTGGTGEKLSLKSMITSKWLYIGGALYVVSALLNIYLLKKLPYSLVVPIGSLTFVWTLFMSNRLIGEKITKSKLAGICLILTGVVLLVIS
ncbi:MAG: EamA family transporter [Lachnospiraceae bacterium]|jgi:drug/metabolite transporter (DMT)-like permease